MLELYSWGKSLRVSGEERALSDVPDVTVELHNSLQTNSATTMGRSTVSEGINVVLQGVKRNSMNLGSFSKEFGIVDPLCTTRDFLASHKEVVGVRVIGVARVNHRIEGSSIYGVSVKHVKVGVVLLSDQLTKSLLVFCV